ncbi:MAG TPA: hypothetical protein VGR79_10155 [Stellaceae bacterium]|nr:hypothetical protein [Stellaceae bacterium]
MIWIDPKDLEHWADLPGCESLLPALVRRLVAATTAVASLVDIPSGSGINLGGWDGIINVSGGSTYVPDGISAWEMSRRKDIGTKADEDYEKRTTASLGVAPIESTFVFVTPRVWATKRDWVAKRKAEGRWKNIRVYDAQDLAQWLERASAVGAWLVRQIGKLPASGIMAADEFWENWSLVTKPILTPALVLAGRGEQAKSFEDWITGQPDQFFVKGETKDEAIAFACAVALRLQDARGINFFSRALVVQSADAWRGVSQHPTPLIIIMDLAEGSPAIAVRRGHHVLVPIGNGDNPNGRGCVLPRLGREEIVKTLGEMGIRGDGAQALARSTGRSLPVLRRRLIGRAGGEKPAWATPPTVGLLLPALLAGQWSETDADRRVIAALAARPYDEVIGVYASLLNQPDAPIRKIGEHWRLTSHEEAWELLAPTFTRQHLERLRDAAVTVLSELAPEYEMPVEERPMAAFQGKARTHSGVLGEGIANTLALMGSHPERAENAGDVQLIANDAVRRILAEPDKWQIWASVGGLLPTLAEAAPDIVLGCIEQGLNKAPGSFETLLKDQDDSLWGGCLHSGLLWALERVAWSPDYFSRAAFILARLAAIDPGGRWANRPKESLRSLFLAWIRCSTMPDQRRLEVLDEMLQRLPHPAWKCLVAASPQSHDTLMHRSQPEWQHGWSQDVKDVTRAEFIGFSNELVARIIQLVGDDPRRWVDLLGVIANFVPAQLDEAISKLEAAAASLREKDGAVTLWHKIREVVGHHRDFPDADWAMPSDPVDRLANIYEALRPADKFSASAWLFDSWPRLLDAEHDVTDYEARSHKVNELRVEALRAIVTEHGDRGAIEFARQVAAPWTVGEALVTVIPDREQLLALVIPNLAHDERALRIFAQAACAALFRKDGWSALEACLAAAKGAADPIRKCVEVYLAAPANMETWQRLERESAETQSAYWSSYENGIFLLSKDRAEFLYGIEHLLDADHPLPVIYAIAHSAADVPVEHIVRALEAAPKALSDAAARKRAISVTNYELQRIFERLDRGNVPLQVIARLEIPFVGILEHSRPNLAVHREVTDNPATFADLVTWAYKRDDGTMDDENLDDGQRSNRAHVAWNVLRNTHRLPGHGDTGTIDRTKLQSWVAEARKLCKERSRGESADFVIGQILASSPKDENRVWPCEVVREVLDSISSEEIGRGFFVGKLNLRGVTSRGVFDGGAQERDLAAEFRRNADAVNARYPFTARLLRTLAESYEHDARREDNEADWRGR